MSNRALSNDEVLLLRAVHQVGLRLKKAPLCERLEVSLSCGHNVWCEESYLNVDEEPFEGMVERVRRYLLETR